MLPIITILISSLIFTDEGTGPKTLSEQKVRGKINAQTRQPASHHITQIFKKSSLVNK